MKRFILALLLFTVLLVAYWAWPLFAMRELAANIQARNPAAVSERVDFPRLRRSLTDQIITAYLRVTGRADKLGVLGNAVASAIGATIADPLVAQIVNPEHLAELLRGGTVPTEAGNVSFNMGDLEAVSLGSLFRAWPATHYGVGRFSIGLPVTAPPTEQVRLRMELLGWHWKLTGIGLPQQLSTLLAQALAKKFP